MKDFPWKLRCRYPNHEGHDALIDNVEMRVDGHGSEWDWKCSTVEGKYKHLEGHAASLEAAKRECEAAGEIVRMLAKPRRRARS